MFNEICTSFISKPNYCEAIIVDDDPENWNVDINTGEFHYNFDDIQITFENDNTGIYNKIRMMKIWKLIVVLVITLILLFIIGLLI